MKLISLSGLVVTLCMVRFGNGELMVSTKFGTVRGKTEVTAGGGEVDVWYGIPYAEPPTGKLRFRSPRPLDRWSGVKNATTLPNSCMQELDTYFGDFEGATMWNANTLLSEDCLYLSVIASKQRSNQSLSVVVWFHGGGFSYGTSTLDVYDYKTFAESQGVIVVAIQHRVGSLGFLYLGDPGAPGNVGLFDQLMALQWVKNNIHSFGGNPDSITLMGDTTGATFVGWHLLSPLSRNLFDKAIMMSGAPSGHWSARTRDDHLVRAQGLAEAVGCPHDLNKTQTILDCLRQANATEILRSEFGVYDGVLDYPFVPLIDGAFLDDSPIELMKEGNMKRAKVLLGSDSEEGFIHLIYYFAGMFSLNTEARITSEAFKRSIDMLLPKFSPFIRKAILHEYTNWANPNDEKRNVEALDKFLGDYAVTCDLVRYAENSAEQGNDVFMYHFDQRSSANLWPSWMGTLLGDRIRFLFGEPSNPNIQVFSDEEKEFSKMMTDYWGNFIKYGYVDSVFILI